MTVADAAALVGLSVASAYAFRKRAAGAAFAVGWSAALLLQRHRLADDLMARALNGVTDTVTNPRGEVCRRHRHDNRLALAMLTRLDRIAAADVPDRTGDARAARLAAGDWDRYLDLIGGDASPAQAGLFLSLRTTEGEAAAIAPIVALARADLYQRTRTGHASEVAIHDLDPAHRERWTAEDWARAEAGGLVTLAAPEPDPEPARTSQLPQHSDAGVWWCDAAEGWRTAFPPPADFAGAQDGEYGDGGYSRALSDAEFDAVEAWQAREVEAMRVPAEAERVRFFADLLASGSIPDEPRFPASGSVGQREPEAATAPPRAAAREGAESANHRHPGRAEPVEATPRTPGSEDGVGKSTTPRPRTVRAEPVEAPSFVPPAAKSAAKGQPLDRLRMRRCVESAGNLSGPAAEVNSAASDGAWAPPAGAGARGRVRSFATA